LDAPVQDNRRRSHSLISGKVFYLKGPHLSTAGQTDKRREGVESSQKSGVLSPGTVVTEDPMCFLGTFDTEEEAQNCFSYARTRLFRFLIILRSVVTGYLPLGPYGFCAYGRTFAEALD